MRRAACRKPAGSRRWRSSWRAGRSCRGRARRRSCSRCARLRARPCARSCAPRASTRRSRPSCCASTPQARLLLTSRWRACTGYPQVQVFCLPVCLLLPCVACAAWRGSVALTVLLAQLFALVRVKNGDSPCCCLSPTCVRAGGSAIASDTIYREVLRVKQAGKPVIVSMGNVAASGGYYIAAPASKIVAQPTSVTGSIGVVRAILGCVCNPLKPCQPYL